jgi:hypothetical protein
MPRFPVPNKQRGEIQIKFHVNKNKDCLQPLDDLSDRNLVVFLLSEISN